MLMNRPFGQDIQRALERAGAAAPSPILQCNTLWNDHLTEAVEVGAAGIVVLYNGWAWMGGAAPRRPQSESSSANAIQRREATGASILADQTMLLRNCVILSIRGIDRLRGKKSYEKRVARECLRDTFSRFRKCVERV